MKHQLDNEVMYDDAGQPFTWEDVERFVSVKFAGPTSTHDALSREDLRPSLPVGPASQVKE